MDGKSTRRFENFCKSLENLKRCAEADPEDDLVVEGTIQRFNLVFDISWKVIKDVLIKEMGVTEFATGSPRETLRTAFSCKVIDDDLWLRMLQDRNTAAHDYDGEFAKEMFRTITGEYCSLFEGLRRTIAGYYAQESNIFGA